jgi:hypothetical protein
VYNGAHEKEESSKSLGQGEDGDEKIISFISIEAKDGRNIFFPREVKAHQHHEDRKTEDFQEMQLICSKSNIS